MKLTSSAFREGETIPKQHVYKDKNLSPALAWEDVPERTLSFALICDDPDAPAGTWVHWLLFNIPADRRELAEGVPAEKTVLSEAKHGKNDWGQLGYGGPWPPPGKPHRYFFKLYALDAPLNLPHGATKSQVEAAMKGHVLADTQLMGKFSR